MVGNATEIDSETILIKLESLSQWQALFYNVRHRTEGR